MVNSPGKIAVLQSICRQLARKEEGPQRLYGGNRQWENHSESAESLEYCQGASFAKSRGANPQLQ